MLGILEGEKMGLRAAITVTAMALYAPASNAAVFQLATYKDGKVMPVGGLTQTTDTCPMVVETVSNELKAYPDEGTPDFRYIAQSDMGVLIFAHKRPSGGGLLIYCLEDLVL